MTAPPLVAHLIYRLAVGGLETLLVDTINRMPADRYRHAILCLDDYDRDFARERITRPGVEIHALHKKPGLGLGTHADVWKLMRRLRPAILHTYNLGTIEYAAPAMLAGVPVRVHAEHGREASDPHGLNRKHNLLRRTMASCIDAYVPVSADLRRWLLETVRIPAAKVRPIVNGVDTQVFAPPRGGRTILPGAPFAPDDIVIGTVGRIQDVKNHRALVDAFAALRERLPQLRDRLRLAIVGDGPLAGKLREQVAAAGLDGVTWLPGARSDIADVLKGFSVFALPSIAEGMPVTILEAMATGLPVVATRVGGIPEVVLDGVTGTLVPAGDTAALADALAKYAADPARIAAEGAASRERIEQHYSMAAMLSAYASLYDGLCAAKTNYKGTIESCAE